MITLYDYWRSLAAYRVRIALNLLNCSFQSIPIDLAKDEPNRPENLAHNP